MTTTCLKIRGLVETGQRTLINTPKLVKQFTPGSAGSGNCCANKGKLVDSDSAKRLSLLAF